MTKLDGLNQLSRAAKSKYVYTVHSPDLSDYMTLVDGRLFAELERVTGGTVATYDLCSCAIRCHNMGLTDHETVALCKAASEANIRTYQALGGGPGFVHWVDLLLDCRPSPQLPYSEELDRWIPLCILAFLFGLWLVWLLWRYTT